MTFLNKPIHLDVVARNFLNPLLCHEIDLLLGRLELVANLFLLLPQGHLFILPQYRFVHLDFFKPPVVFLDRGRQMGRPSLVSRSQTVLDVLLRGGGGLPALQARLHGGLCGRSRLGKIWKSENRRASS